MFGWLLLGAPGQLVLYRMVANPADIERLSKEEIH